MKVTTVCYEVMMTTEQIAIWSMAATCISAFAAALSALFTLRTINSWKKASIHQSHKEFKKAIYHYHEISRILPHQAFPQDRQAQQDDFLAFKKAKMECSYAWAMTEGTITNPEVIRLWSDLESVHHEYMLIRELITTVQDNAAALIEIHFIR